MRKIILQAAAVAMAALLGVAVVSKAAYPAGCVDNYPPQAYAQFLQTNANGSKNYVLYKWDSDSGNVPGSMAVYNTQGQIKAQSSTGYINLTQPKGSGYWHVDGTDVNSCGGYVKWVRTGIALYN